MRKNILIFCHSPATQFIDACNQYVGLFDREKYHVTVAYLCGAREERAEERTQSERVIFLNQSKRAVRGLKLAALWALYRLCRAQKFYMVICHRYKPFYLYLLTEKLLPPAVLLFVAHDQETLTSRSRCLLIRLLARKNTYFAGVSNAMRDVLCRALSGGIPHERIATLYNAVDMPSLQASFLQRSDARARLELPSEALVFGTTGRLEANKDQATLIRAFGLIQSKCPDALLLIVGEGEEAASLKALASECGVGECVQFAGFLPEGWRYLPAVDVFLLTSAGKESFGRVLAEAMTAGVPVIGVKTGGIPEVIGDAGALVPPRDPHLLAAEMLRYYEMTPGARLQQGERGRLRIQARFSLPHFYESFWNFVPHET